MRQRDTLRAAGGAGRVDDGTPRCQVRRRLCVAGTRAPLRPGIDVLGQVAVAPGDDTSDPGLGGRVHCHGSVVGAGQHHVDTGILEDVAQLTRGELGVYRHF
ncbi:hypothetical protein GCM10009790_37940 [Georgenia ruanii]